MRNDQHEDDGHGCLHGPALSLAFSGVAIVQNVDVLQWWHDSEFSIQFALHSLGVTSTGADVHVYIWAGRSTRS